MKQFKVISLYFFLIVNLFSGIQVNAKSIVSADIIEGQQYVPNFLKEKGHFEKNANGAIAYADAAGTRPVDGTGGVANLTCTRTVSTPLDGDGSLLITKDAINRQGQGCSIQFTIDSAQKAKVLQIEFDYQVASGTFTAGSSSADSDIIVYLYDVTNSTLIEPSSIKLLSNSTSISDHFVSNFQTSATGTTYNLILHQATTSASAYTLKADNFVVKPSSYVYGTPITDWISYTPTFVGFGTVVNISTYWRRVGSSLETYGRFTSGTPTAVTATMSLPSGQTIGGATGLRNYYGVVNRNGGAHLQIMSIESQNVFKFGGGASSHGDVNGDALLGVGETVYFNSSGVPILGWSSSAQMSDSYDGRLIAARYTTTGGVTSWASGQVVKYTTLVFDKTNSYSSSTGLFTCPSSGVYRVTAQFYGTTNFTYIYLGKNGSAELSRIVQEASSGTTGSILVECNAGDTLGIYNAAATVSSVDGSGFNSVSFEKLQSPTTISATEVIAAAYNSSATTISSVSATIVYTSKVSDTHGAYSTSTGKFTCPVAGSYEVNASIFGTSTFTTQQASTMAVRKNSTDLYEVIQRHAASEASQGYQIMSPPIECLAGDTLEIRFALEGTTPSITASSTKNYVGFKRIK